MLVKRSFEGLEGTEERSRPGCNTNLRFVCSVRGGKPVPVVKKHLCIFHRYPVLCCTVHSCILSNH